MKINNIDYPMTNERYKYKSYLDHISQKTSVCFDKDQSINKERQLNREYKYSGSFTGKEKAAANISSKLLEGLIDACNNHTTIVQNLVALGLALGPRTLAILSLPGKDKNNKENKIYAAGHAWASGLIGFGFSTIVMYPLGEAAKKVREDAQIILSKIEKSNDVKLVTRRLKKLSTEKNPDIEKLKPENILEGTSFWDTDPEKYIKKYGVPYDKEFLEQFSSIDESGKLSKVIDLNNNVDYEKYYNDYNAKNLTRENLLKGTKHIKDKFADKFLKNFVELGKDGEFIKINKKLNFDYVYKAVNMAPDVFIFGVAKAMLTVALIPPILKYVFGLEKNKPTENKALSTPTPNVKTNPILDPKSKVEGGAK